MNAKLKFRAFEPRDSDAVLAMNQAAVPAVSSVSAKQLSDLNAMASDFLLMHSEGALAGFVILMSPGAPYESVNYQWFSARYSRFVYIDRIVIDPPFHRQGIASAAYARAWRDARQQAVALTCEVNVVPPNPQSMAFHLDFGFSEVGRQHTDSGKKLVSLLAREPSAN